MIKRNTVERCSHSARQRVEDGRLQMTAVRDGAVTTILYEINRNVVP